MKWQDTKMSNLGDHIANIALIQGKNAKMYPIAFQYAHELWLSKGLHISLSSPTQLGVPPMKICIVCDENLVEDKYHLCMLNI